MKKDKNQYIQANRDWLVKKSQEDGVKALPKGVFYKVLAEGDHSGATPTPGSVITAHYTGWTIDGNRFAFCMWLKFAMLNSNIVEKCYMF